MEFEDDEDYRECAKQSRAGNKEAVARMNNWNEDAAAAINVKLAHLVIYDQL